MDAEEVRAQIRAEVAAQIRAEVAEEIAVAIQNMDVPGVKPDLAGPKAVGFYTARGIAVSVARCHAVEGGRHPRDIVDYITGGGL